MSFGEINDIDSVTDAKCGDLNIKFNDEIKITDQNEEEQDCLLLDSNPSDYSKLEKLST